MVLAIAVLLTIAALLLRRSRWAAAALLGSRCAYAALLVQALWYFPARGGFRIATPTCEWTFGVALAVHSLQNYKHIVLFALFYLLTFAQLPNLPKARLWSAAACMTMGLFVELAQGATRVGHCRMRDLIPDAIGALIAIAVLAGLRKIWPAESVSRDAPR